jgi:RHS repeat-associated protein
MLQNTQTFGQALIAALALATTGSVGLAVDAQYYVNDPLATTVAIADAAGEIAAMEADAFGAPLAIGEAPGRFTGKPYDADLGAYVFPFRNYRPEEGRWMSADPSGFPDGMNGRTYAPNVFSSLDSLGLVARDLTQQLSGNDLILLDDSIRQVLSVPGGGIAAWAQDMPLSYSFLKRYMSHSGDQTIDYSNISEQPAVTLLNNAAKSSAASGSQLSSGSILSTEFRTFDLRNSLGGVYVNYSYKKIDSGWAITGKINDPYDFQTTATGSIPGLREVSNWNGDHNLVSDIWMRQLAEVGFAKVFKTKIEWTIYSE